MTNVVVTHVDSTTTTYLNCFAGISNDQGNGWKLSVIPTDSSQPSFVVELRSGETYQTVGALPDPATFASGAAAAAPTPSADAVTPGAADAAPPAAAIVIADALAPGTTDTVTAPAGMPDPKL
jgi:hypothetical protein